MNNFMLNVSGAELSRLRAKVEAVGKEIGGVTGSPALAAHWAELVQILDLGAEPVMQHCPHCQAPCMEGASRCGNCWGSLPASRRHSASDPGGKTGAAASG